MPSKSISLWSLDFDGCLLNIAALERLNRDNPQTVLATAQILTNMNQALLNFIKTQTSTADLTIVMNGSNRQSSDIDAWNGLSRRGISIFQMLPYIANAIPKAALDATLLPDVFCDLEPGSTWASIVDSDPIQPGCPLDESKILLLYLQMHHAAKTHLKNAEDTISFNFVDDRSDILQTLQQYCQQNPQMIPKGMTLKLYQYHGEQPVPFASITGTAAIDASYPTTIKAFTHAAHMPINSGWEMVGSAYHGLPSVKMEKLANYRDRVQPAIKPEKPQPKLELPQTNSQDDLSSANSNDSSASSVGPGLVRYGFHRTHSAQASSGMLSSKCSSLLINGSDDDIGADVIKQTTNMFSVLRS